jgi:hypothetical protein
MQTATYCKYSKLFFLLALSVLASGVNSCGQTQASSTETSSPANPSDAVMKVIRDYGRDHNPLLFPGNTDKPTEDGDVYEAGIRALLNKKDFAQLEKIAAKNRVEKGRVIGGFSKNNEFYEATGCPEACPSQLKDSDYQARLEILNQWLAAYPDSAAAQISLAEFYDSYAFFARGGGLANTVKDEQWNLYNQRLAEMLPHLLAAAKSKERDPHWYSGMIMLAQAEGWDKSRTRELVDQAIAFEPDYYHYYRLYANYLLPQWYGERGEVQKFAEEASSQLSEPNGSIVYFQVLSSLLCYCQQSMEDLHSASYPKLRQGYLGLTEFYGVNNLIANRGAFIATMARDKSVAHEAFSHINSPVLDIWSTERIFDDTREWATSPD